MSCDEEKLDASEMTQYPDVNVERHRFPFCIVWTPIPLLTWMFPFIGHMGICTSHGVIRDFAGPYHVSEDNMAFGNPTKYWQLDPDKVTGGAAAWDRAIAEAAEVYKGRMHNLCCDNCHSMVAMALNKVKYNGSSNWNMVSLALMSLLRSQYVSVGAWIKTWLPFLLWASSLAAYIAILKGIM
ncbi:transmembrane protein 222-like [Macrosteles quadrilineatus]|uniref:transmembrane protein 222-like n=1 Tax=Macrosteles quadrilineatus TaxID=74068 RepID=UPI0023E1117F|nr:transmembrane protein 222-like [Macrosteles quadrilineatus]